MEIVVSGRAGGKTHQLVEAAVLEKLRGGDPCIMVAGEQEKYHTEHAVFQCFQQHGVVRPEAEGWAKEIVRTPSFLVGHGRTSDPTMYIDNLERVLQRMFGLEKIAMVTENAPVRTPQGKRFEPFADNPHARAQL